MVSFRLKYNLKTGNLIDFYIFEKPELEIPGVGVRGGDRKRFLGMDMGDRMDGEGK